MAVYFYNKEPIDLMTIAVLGVSVKVKDNPIGRFGTGSRFAISTLLRHGCKVTLIRDGETIEFTSRAETIRGEEFNRVYMGDQALGFTTQLGRDWEPWQAYRELYCNCLDEGGVISTEEPEGDYGTIFIVEGEPIEMCHRNRHEIFLMSEPIAASEYAEMHKGETTTVFYRSVRAHQEMSLCLYTYNVTAQLDLTEDRTVKNPWWMKQYISRLIPTIEDEEIIENIVLAGNGTFEAGLDLDAPVTPSAEFMAVCYRNRQNVHMNQSALKMWERHAETRLVVQEVGIDAYEESVLTTSMKLLKKIGCGIERDDFFIVEGLGNDIFGCVRRNQILIAKRTFDMGPRFLASTLYEEWLHKTEHMQDESRDLQNFLFEKLFAMTERVMAMEDAGTRYLEAAE